jgi:hypothetical protein
VKLTWFGGTALRIQIGGKILVCDPAGAGPEVSQSELMSGADTVFRLEEGPGTTDAARWQPRRAPSALDEAASSEVLVHDIGSRSVIVDAPGEPPLLVLGEPLPRAVATRWTSEAVAVVFSGGAAGAALAGLSPRLIALAEEESRLEAAVDGLRDRLDGTGLIVLERGMALEV